VPIAEGAVSWNGFLKQVGFNPPTIYEVSGEGVLLQGELIAADQFELRCREGDILNISPPFSRISTVTPTPPAGTDYRSSGTMFETDDPPEVFGSIPIGFSFRGSIHEISTGDRIPAPSDLSKGNNCLS